MGAFELESAWRSCHILDERRTRPHELPDFARVEDGRLVYDGGQMGLS